jgi:hypothetical protein
MELIKMPSAEEQKRQAMLEKLVRENCKGMSISQINLYLEHLKNKLKTESDGSK